MRSKALLPLLLLTVGCASIRESARRVQPAQQALPESPQVQGSAASAGQVSPTRTSQSDPTEAIAEVRKEMACADQAGRMGASQEALAHLDRASELLAETEDEPGTDPGVAEARSVALSDLREAYRRLWPSVAHLSSDTPLPALLGMLEADTTAVDLRPSHDMLGLIQRIRAESDIPIVYNTRVGRSLSFFQDKGREPFGRWLSRSARYRTMMRPILAAEGLPEDLVYLSMIESGFSPYAYSNAHASGLWQFIPSTGRVCGLRQDWFADERRDPVKSTTAAARYLKGLYAELGDWYLVLAAYNCGKGRVLRAIEKADSRNYWDLKLPRETQWFVPHFIAALILSKAPGRFGFDAIEYEPPLAFDEVAVGQLTLDVAAECAATTYSELKALNPELRRWCTPPQEAYPLRIPQGTRQQFLKAYASLPAHKRVSWHRHRVARGETVSGLALRYGTSQKAIISANNLTSRHRIRAGTYLVIPSPGKPKPTAHPNARSKKALHDPKAYYVVKKGDTLSRIARDFGVTVRMLRQWNPAARRRFIHPGDRLAIGPTESVAASREASLVAGHASATAMARGAARKKVYTVTKGDALERIAREHGVTVAMLRQWNPGASHPYIYPGDRLTIWVPNGTPDPSSHPQAQLASASSVRPDGPEGSQSEGPLYIVKKGDTLWDIARRQGVGLRDLALSNDLDRDATIYPGDELRIPHN